jgi:ATP-dependent RNA helicase RhlE
VQIAARNATADLVTHVVHPCAREKKRELLCHIIQSRGLKQVLVFTGTRIGANRLAHQLRANHIQVDAIHGDKTQGEREAALEAFKTGKTTVLVATDVASRGLDIESLPQVINFDIPHSPEDYVHRIGRTGRAGLTGEAISLVAPEDMEALGAIEKLINKKLERVLVPGFANAGTVATMVSGEHASGNAGRSRQENHRRPERDRRPQQQKPQHPAAQHATAPHSAPQHANLQPRPAQKFSDPIFSKPYEPGATSIAPKPVEEPVGLGKRRDRPVAALLGGLKRA